MVGMFPCVVSVVAGTAYGGDDVSTMPTKDVTTLLRHTASTAVDNALSMPYTFSIERSRQEWAGSDIR